MLAFIGGLTGVSSTQLGISEIGVSYPDSTFGEESRFGTPFIVHTSQFSYRTQPFYSLLPPL